MRQPKLLRNGTGAHLFKHGLSRSPEHRIWSKINERCYNPHHVNYSNYGGRGITVCESWRTFTNFYRDMGDRPSPDHSIERKNNLLGYSPENCKWATSLEQANNKRTNVMVAFRGRIQSIAAWCRELGLNYGLTRQRIYRDKKTPEQAFQL